MPRSTWFMIRRGGRLKSTSSRMRIAEAVSPRYCSVLAYRSVNSPHPTSDRLSSASRDRYLVLSLSAAIVSHMVVAKTTCGMNLLPHIFVRIRIVCRELPVSLTSVILWQKMTPASGGRRGLEMNLTMSSSISRSERLSSPNPGVSTKVTLTLVL